MSLGKAGPFELIELLGEGAVGQVYSARDPVLGRQVAVKMLRRELSSDREFLDRFYGEAQRLGDLNHVNITTLYGLYFEGDKPFMAMELVRGRTLKDLLQRAQRLPPRESLAVMAQTLAGLAYAHRAGVIHRDIKPANLMVTDSGIVKIMDFGIARVRGSLHMTRAGQAFLTPLYASPEQIKGEEVDERSDLYSLGIVFYEMLAGRPPFTARSEYLLERAHLEDAPPPLSEAAPDLDPGVAAAVMRALAKSPADRFAGAEEFAHAVGARTIRGDAPDILQEFIAAAFRGALPDETRQLDRASGPRGRSSSISLPRDTGAMEAGIESWQVSQRHAETPSLRSTDTAREPGSQEYRSVPAGSDPLFPDTGPGLVPGLFPTAEDRLSASSSNRRSQPRGRGRVAFLSGITVALAASIGCAGILYWIPVAFDWLSAPGYSEAERPPHRPDGPSQRLPVMSLAGSHAVLDNPPNRTPSSYGFSPVPPPETAPNPASQPVVSIPIAPPPSVATMPHPASKPATLPSVAPTPATAVKRSARKPAASSPIPVPGRVAMAAPVPTSEFAPKPEPTAPSAGITPMAASFRTIVATALRQRPDKSARRLTMLKPGTKVTITGKGADGDWYKVEVPGAALEGYVAASAVRETRLLEATEWQRIQKRRDAASFAGFLRKYPRGVHAAAASARLETLRRATAASVTGTLRPPDLPDADGNSSSDHIRRRPSVGSGGGPCTTMIERSQLGEPVSDADRAIAQNDCR
jgi:tRNA A-37 threonylcarbamoyl transferase component Bud32